MVNSINNNMKSTKLSVGIITPPNEEYKPKFYNEAETMKRLRRLDRDAYRAGKRDSYNGKVETPKSIIIIGIGLAAAAIFCLVNKKFKLETLVKK